MSQAMTSFLMERPEHAQNPLTIRRQPETQFARLGLDYYSVI